MAEVPTVISDLQARAITELFKDNRATLTNFFLTVMEKASRVSGQILHDKYSLTFQSP